MRTFPFYKDAESMACGPICIWLIASFYGKKFNLEDLIIDTETDKKGATLYSITKTAEKIGFNAAGAKLTYEDLIDANNFPCIVYWRKRHYLVVYKIENDIVFCSDPGVGLIEYSKEEFKNYWILNKESEGCVLFMEPTSKFYQNGNNEIRLRKFKIASFLKNYLVPHKRSYLKLFFLLLLGSLIQLIFPFLTQKVVDDGIKQKDIHLIYLLLFGQLMLFLARVSVDVFKNWILLKMGNNISIALVKDFFGKLVKLPISYFDKQLTGDILQRIQDNQRIEMFTTNSFRILFSLMNFVVFTVILAFYNISIFFTFIIVTGLYFIWIIKFFKKREEIDNKLFVAHGKNNNKILELIHGMPEIKLFGAENKKRWEWQAIQNSLLKLNLTALKVSQLQHSGASLINELKNIFIIFLSAKLVLDNQITFGMMLSISYINGQLSGPLNEFVIFMQQLQNAKLSSERILEIHSLKEEDSESKEKFNNSQSNLAISIKNLNFSYRVGQSENILENLNLEIPEGKITAIIGVSGSGKTTLMKLLLKYYEASEGAILVGNKDLKNISTIDWRKNCGVVMQDGYIFSDTLANNIAIGDEHADMAKVVEAARLANLSSFIDQLPNNFNTIIGSEGIGLSNGQKQRILIARAIYRNPKYLFLDEATNALDAETEKTVNSNLYEFFKNKTVVVIAHRLSTVKNADRIVVLKKGRITESGNHQELTSKQGVYYELIKNQLDLAG